MCYLVCFLTVTLLEKLCTYLFKLDTLVCMEVYQSYTICYHAVFELYTQLPCCRG